MLNNLAVLLALRSHLLTLQFAGTGVTTLAATGNGYTRAAGSFIDDGFVTGIEVVPDGFADNTPGIVRTVTDTEITLLRARTAEAAATGRSLTVGIPLIRGWENKRMERVDERWDIEEDYIPGPSAQNTVGIRGGVDHYPTYVLRIKGLSDMGVSALFTVADGLLAAFPPRLEIPVSDGTLIRVRSNPAPYRGQVMQLEAGEAGVVVTFPLWVRTINPI